MASSLVTQLQVRSPTSSLTIKLVANQWRVQLDDEGMALRLVPGLHLHSFREAALRLCSMAGRPFGGTKRKVPPRYPHPSISGLAPMLQLPGIAGASGAPGTTRTCDLQVRKMGVGKRNPLKPRDVADLQRPETGRFGAFRAGLPPAVPPPRGGASRGGQTWRFQSRAGRGACAKTRRRPTRQGRRKDHVPRKPAVIQPRGQPDDPSRRPDADRPAHTRGWVALSGPPPHAKARVGRAASARLRGRCLRLSLVWIPDAPARRHRVGGSDPRHPRPPGSRSTLGPRQVRADHRRPRLRRSPSHPEVVGRSRAQPIPRPPRVGRHHPRAPARGPLKPPRRCEALRSVEGQPR